MAKEIKDVACLKRLIWETKAYLTNYIQLIALVNKKNTTNNISQLHSESMAEGWTTIIAMETSKTSMERPFFN